MSLLKYNSGTNSELYQSILQEKDVLTLLGILKLSDEEAFIHSLGVASLVDGYISLAIKNNELEWSKEMCMSILRGALLHDIGKAFLPFGLTQISDKLSNNEREIIKVHPFTGAVAIQNSEFDEIVQNIVLMHHANADGTGYPMIQNKILKIDNVPDYVWLVIYADRFEAMTNSRHYKHGAKSYPEAWKVLLQESREGRLPYHFTRLFGELVRKDSLQKIDMEGGNELEDYE